jgi:hypothetical protein
MKKKLKETDTKCPECGSSILDSEWLPPSFSIICRACGWSVVTSRFPPIFEDQQIYKVFLVPEHSDPLQVIIAIKTYQGVTSAEAKILANQNQAFLFQGQATDIFGKVKKLFAKDVKVRIEPEFKYTDADLMGIKIS